MKKKKNNQLRTCSVCRRKDNINQFTRFVIEQNNLVIDKNRDKKGRGMNICKEGDCISKINFNLVKKALKTELKQIKIRQD
ncbi:MAG: YlxR family protein [Candidatus Gracilibacteria bacterium]|nr:YlxR family protein [Candidatus Gracilibacteria bacterium]